MNNREHFDFLVKNNVRSQGEDKELIRTLVNKLLDCLYTPRAGDNAFMPDLRRRNEYGIDSEEPVNWGGGLSCSVEKEGNLYIISIEEAAPNDCPTLCEYIEKYMSSWGWDNIEVLTEW